MTNATAEKWMVELDGVGEAFACRSDQNLLAAMIAARQTGIKVGCRSGGCGGCPGEGFSRLYARQKMKRLGILEAGEGAGLVPARRISPLSDLGVTPLPLTPGAAVS